MSTVKTIIESLKAALPPLCSRKEIESQTGGLVKRRHLANLDSAGRGPSGKVRIGKRLVGYERDSFLDWLEKQLTLGGEEAGIPEILAPCAESKRSGNKC